MGDSGVFFLSEKYGVVSARRAGKQLRGEIKNSATYVRPSLSDFEEMQAMFKDVNR